MEIRTKDIKNVKPYSIKMYNMIVHEIKQNNKSLKYDLEELQDILNMQNSMKIWYYFNKKKSFR